MAFLVLASLTVLLLGTSHGELMQDSTDSHGDGKPTEQFVPVTEADGKPCEPTGGGGGSDSCQSSTSKPISSVETEKAFSTTKEDVISIDTKATTSFPTPCSLQQFVLMNCNYTCDSDVCTDSGNYESIMCNDTSSPSCAMICEETLQKYQGNCFVNSTSTVTTTTSSDINRFLISINPPSSAPLSLSTIIIAITVMAVVLILALLIIIVVTLWLVFRYKTKTIQQRPKDSADEERYVMKEMGAFSGADSKDPLYDTIDDTVINRPALHTSFAAGLQPPLRDNTQSENISIPPPPNRVPLTYEEPISSLSNSKQVISLEGAEPDITLPVEAEYSLLEGPACISPSREEVEAKSNSPALRTDISTPQTYIAPTSISSTMQPQEYSNDDSATTAAPNLSAGYQNVGPVYYTLESASMDDI